MFVILYKDTSHLHMSESKRPREEKSAEKLVMENDDLRELINGYLPYRVGDYPNNPLYPEDRCFRTMEAFWKMYNDKELIYDEINVTYYGSSKGFWDVFMDEEDEFVDYEKIKLVVVIPDNETSIAEKAFWNCISLTSVVFPNSLQRIEYMAFCNCSLTSVDLSNTQVSAIEDSAFFGCEKLTSVTFPNSLVNILGHAFERCSSLNDVTLPAGVNLGENAFPEGVEIINNTGARLRF